MLSYDTGDRVFTISQPSKPKQKKRQTKLATDDKKEEKHRNKREQHARHHDTENNHQSRAFKKHPSDDSMSVCPLRTGFRYCDRFDLCIQAHHQSNRTGLLKIPPYQTSYSALAPRPPCRCCLHFLPITKRRFFSANASFHHRQENASSPPTQNSFPAIFSVCERQRITLSHDFRPLSPFLHRAARAVQLDLPNHETILQPHP